MKLFLKSCFAMLVCVGLAGCSDGGGSMVEDAEQSAVDAYLQAEAEEQAALETEMSEGLDAADQQ